MPPTPPPQTGGSVSDLVTIGQNLVTALNNAATTYLNVNGKQTAANLSAATLVKATAGRVCTISVTTIGSTLGYIYDSNQVSAPTNPMFSIANSVYVQVVNMPTSFGIVVVPGTGQVVSVSFS